MSLSASTSRVLTYSVDPTSPSSSAPQNPNRTAFLHVGRTTKLHSGFQYGGHTGAVVVDAGTLWHAVEVGARHDDVVGRPGLGLRDHVAGVVDANARVEGDRRRGGFVAQARAVVLGDADGGDLHFGALPQRAAADVVAVLVVRHDQRDRATFGGDGLLVTERARAAVDEDDGTRDVEAVVVRRRASRPWPGAGGHQAARDPALRRAGRVHRAAPP